MLHKVTKFVLFSILGFFVFGCICYLWIEVSSSSYLSYNAYKFPKCRTALVLGTSSRLSSGTSNLYFHHRMKAAEYLYKKGRIRQMILSGDNREQNYNEPRAMARALKLRGVPETALIADYAGLRTFDSMVRSKEIFGQDTVVVVSQKFHNARAVFIGRKIGLVVYGYNAEKVLTQSALKIQIREFFSRIRCVLDLYVLNTKPRHLGERILID
jgi:SanA protein